MKNILFVFLFLSATIFAQQSDKKWDKIIAFEKEGKIKSANEIVADIYKNAKAKKDEEQIIKCFFYQSKYIQILEENAQTKIINNLKATISQVSAPSKAILNIVYANCLNNYFNTNNYQITQRTNIETASADFLTWTQKNFEDQINAAMKETLQNENLLRSTPLSKYESIFDYANSEKFKTENLYNYVLDQNINFYTQELHRWEIPKTVFIPYKKDFFGDSPAFTKLNLDFITNANLRLVVSLYQKKESNSPTSDNQFERLLFCKNFLFQADEDYSKALDKLQKKADDKILIQKIQLEKVQYLVLFASKTLHPDYNTKALAILDSIIQVNNRSNEHKKAISQKQKLLSKSLTVQLQKYIYNNENTRAFIQYKNVEHLKISFYKIDQQQVLFFMGYRNSRETQAEEIVNNKKPEITEAFTLKDKKDYFQYSTEVLLPNLKTGSYLVYFETEKDTKDEKATAFETLTVTNLSISVSEVSMNETYQVLDRKKGNPLKNVKVSSPRFTAITDKNGKVSYNKIGKGRNYETLQVSFENDTITIGNNYILRNYAYQLDTVENLQAKVEFYLDRAIYRPGQTVYFKGIAIQKNNDKTSVVPNTAFRVLIQDPNNSDFKEFNITTNEFGSFSGEFTLPKTGLMGNFSITALKPANFEKEKEKYPFWVKANFDYSQTHFRVEEYKRPKFEVTFDPKKETFQVNQSVKVKGTAKAFAGSNVSDATVDYTVKRFTSYMNNYFGREDEEEIAEGEVKTDASGKFIIDFTALPPEDSNKKELPIFTYEIEVSVTDINGETHESRTEIKVGYHDLILEAAMPSKIQTKDKNEIILTSTNLNGEFKAANGEVKIYFVRPFLNKFKIRSSEKPEIETISDQDFEKLFPYEITGKEFIDEPKETLVYSKKVNTEKDKTIALDFISSYKSGSYKIVFSANDSFNNLIEATTNFQLTQSKDKFNPSKLFTAQQINDDPKKDGFVEIKLTSPIQELYINTAGNYKSGLFFEETNHLQNNEAVVKIPLRPEFEKILKLTFESIFENQVFNDELDVTLKSETPKLEWKAESFRSKIEPGSTENWSFQLKASNTKKEAEVLASMYDSSLDKFTFTKWNGPTIYDYNYNSGNRKTILGFGEIYQTLHNLNSYIPKMQFSSESTSLIWFGFDFNNPNGTYQQSQYLKQLIKKVKKPANAKMISGILTDTSGLALPGVSVTVKGTPRTATSDFDGYYEIEAVTGEELVFSYLGFKNTSVKVANDKVINLSLEDDSSQLQEVVVIGYGTQKKQSLTGAVTRLESADFKVQADIQASDSTFMAKAVRIIPGDINNPEYYFQTKKLIFVPGKKIVSGLTSMIISSSTLYIIDGEISSEENFKKINPEDLVDIDFLTADKAIAIYGNKASAGAVIITTKKAMEALTQVKARKNLSETAFFFPHLKTDAKGNISFNFTSPEALTKWKLRLLAHNKDAVSGYLEKSIITQKELMVLPNFPRFFREKDTIIISAKISNVTNEAKTGIASLQFFDATTMQPIDGKMLNAKNIKNFTINAFGNTSVNWTIAIPEGLQGVQYKIVAKSGNFSDGEENILPVLTNNMLVTESIPLWVRENSTKEYTFENLKNNNSSTLRNHQFTLEYTSNPTWIAIQSLPYLMEYEHECAEQTFARFYANALASEIISSNPKIAGIFETWRKNGKLHSKLEDNEELKSIILAETPWLNDAQSEDEKKKNLALLFDLEKMKTSQEATFEKLKKKQTASGGFRWFDGYAESEYITRHILAGLGHLAKLSTSEDNEDKIDQIAKNAIPYLDNDFLEYYRTRTQNLKATDKLIWINPYSDLHYLYTRSFYLENYPMSDELKKASKLYLETAKKDWLQYSLYEKGLAAVTLNRFGEKETAKKIIESLKETSSNNEDWGMYWIANKSGWYWYQAPIETQALLIEAFAEVTNDTKSVDAMKVWLLKNKQTKNWPTTKSTTEAIYALLMQGTDWLSVKDNTVIKLGDEKIVTKKLAENEKEAETGYIKLNWKAEEIKKEMASIKIENKSKVPGFGGVYWQYFEDLDKIKNDSGAVLSVSKELYLKKNTPKGDELQKITTENSLKIGDLVTVRLIITSKEDVEYIHLKDMRASCFEPVNVLSEYQYKDRLGFYMSTKDAATHFFFDHINRGTYVLEYDIRVNNGGEFSNGITTIQSMYAPEFSSHTKGIRVKVN